MEFLSFDAPSKSLTLKKAPVPKPGPGDVLIRVAYSGVCGTDLHILEVNKPKLLLKLFSLIFNEMRQNNTLNSRNSLESLESI